MALTSNLEELEESEERIFCYLGNKLKENIEINEKWCECVMLIVVFLNPSCLFRSKHIMMGTEILSFRFSPAFLVQQQFLANVLYNLALMVTQICSVLQIKYSMLLSIGTIFYSEIVFPKFRRCSLLCFNIA